MPHEQAMEILAQSKFFRNLPEEEIHKVASRCESAAYAAGASVFKQGDYGENIYVIVEGHVHLERDMNMGNRKGSVLIDTLGTGRTLGCWSALLGQPHVLMSTANCQKATTVLKISGKRLRRLMTEDADFGFAMLERLCFLLRDRIQAAYGAMDRL